MKEIDNVQQHVSSVSVSRKGVADQAVPRQYEPGLKLGHERERGLTKSEFQPDEQQLVDATATIEALYPEHADEADKLLTDEMGRVYSNGKKVSICRKSEEVFASVYKKIKRRNLHLANQTGFE